MYRSMGVQIGDEHIYSLLFSEDQVILDEDVDDVEYTVRKLIEEYSSWRLEINTVLHKHMKNGMNAVENGYWKRCCELTLKDHNRTEELRKIMDIKQTLTDTIKVKQLKWYGHMRRVPDDRLPLKHLLGL